MEHNLARLLFFWAFSCRLLCVFTRRLSCPNIVNPEYRSIQEIQTHARKSIQRSWAQRGASAAKPPSHAGWRTTGGMHQLAPHLFSINGTRSCRVNSGSCSVSAELFSSLASRRAGYLRRQDKGASLYLDFIFLSFTYQHFLLLRHVVTLFNIQGPPTGDHMRHIYSHNMSAINGFGHILCSCNSNTKCFSSLAAIRSLVGYGMYVVWRNKSWLLVF